VTSEGFDDTRQVASPILKRAFLLNASCVSNTAHRAAGDRRERRVWEWRTFARCPAYSGILAALETGDVAATREHYLLSLVSPHNVKIQNDCRDMKTLVAEDATSLQQWRPVWRCTLLDTC
jgi:hypothetical protein